MELRHLRYFVAIAEELNFRKAAERLRVAQPALSSQIQDLEAHLGTRVFDRNTAGVRLTDAGAAFLTEVRQILAHAERAGTVAREAAQGRRGRLVVGYFAPIFMGLMPGSLKAFRGKYPDVDVELVEMPIMDQIAALEAGTLHVGFTVARGMPLPADLSNVAVGRSHIRVVMSKGHALAKMKRISLAQLATEQILCFVAKKGYPSVHGDLVRQFFDVRGLKHRPIRNIDGVEAFSAMLESGLGISLVAELGSLARGEGLLLRPLKETGSDLFVELHALWRTDQPSQLTANFIDVMLKVAPRTKPRV
ncbi:MAG: LysR substrate-binding domain-containing protein [Lacunisphaera sp.]